MNEYMPPMLVELLQQELVPGERIVWQGRPSPLRRALALMNTFLYGAVAMTILFVTWNAKPGWVASGKPFLSDAGWDWFRIIVFLVGARALCSPLWAGWVAYRTVYAVTDRRAILVEAMPLLRTIRSFFHRTLITFICRADERGRGDIIFEQKICVGPKGRSYIVEAGFFSLPDIKIVAHLLHATYANLKRA